MSSHLYKITINQSTLFYSAFLWLKYGIMLVNVTMTIVNGIGTILATYAIIIYHHYTHHRAKDEWNILLSLLLLCCLLGSIRIGWMNKGLIGWCGVFLNIVMNASPLIAIVTIFHL